jgi:hypothetical protein
MVVGAAPCETDELAPEAVGIAQGLEPGDDIGFAESRRQREWPLQTDRLGYV